MRLFRKSDRLAGLFKLRSAHPRDRPASAQQTTNRARIYWWVSRISLVYACVLVPLFFWGNMQISDAPSFFDTYLPGVFPDTVKSYFASLWSFALLLGLWTLKRSRRHALPRFTEIPDDPCVVYLRPFEEDRDLRGRATWGRDATLKLKDTTWHVLKATWRAKSQSPAEVIAELTRTSGTMVAIGEPSSPPVLGADNVYVSDNDWQDKVLRLLQNASMVVLTTGTTPGVLWEVEQAVAHVPPTRFLLLVPGMTPARRRKAYARFRAAAGPLFPNGLPADLPQRAFSFDTEWRAVEDLKERPAEGTTAALAWWLARLLP